MTKLELARVIVQALHVMPKEPKDDNYMVKSLMGRPKAELEGRYHQAARIVDKIESGEIRSNKSTPKMESAMTWVGLA